MYLNVLKVFRTIAKNTPQLFLYNSIELKVLGCILRSDDLEPNG